MVTIDLLIAALWLLIDIAIHGIDIYSNHMNRY